MICGDIAMLAALQTYRQQMQYALTEQANSKRILKECAW
jgi:hypothetical protein